MSEEVNEEVIVQVTEAPPAEKVKEMSFTLNTLGEGRAEYITPVINGVLEVVILEADLPLQVYITLADYPDIVLFDSFDIPIYSPVFLPLRVQPISNKYEGFTQAPEKWVLNDRIKCEVEGPLNATAKIVLRYI